MRLRQIWMSLAVLAFAGWGAVVHAQSREEKFQDFDKNRDGVLTQAEYPAHPGNFRAMDCNHDGVLSRDEFLNRYQCDETGNAPAAAPAAPPQIKKAPQAPAGDEFSRLDHNGDGVVNKVEWHGDAATFRRLDRNADGQITADEYANPPAANDAQARFDTLDRNDDGVLSRYEWRGERVRFDVADRNRDRLVSFDEYLSALGTGTVDGRYQALDRDNDGRIEHVEWRGTAAEFDRLDRNNDGVITADEFANRPAAGDRQARFDTLDRNNDGVLSAYEWRGESVRFNEADRDRDRVVSFDEYMNLPSGRVSGSGDRIFDDMDHDHDRILTRSEWHGDAAAFDLKDQNRDGVLTLGEYRDRSYLADRFRADDHDGDGYISREEWHRDLGLFDRLDRNRDGRVSRDEFITM